MKSFSYLILIFVLLSGCARSQNAEKQETKAATPTSPGRIATIEILDDRVRTILDENAAMAIIARGFKWAEGPLWLKDQKTLLFSDVPENKIYSWSETKGVQVWLEPSGYTGPAEQKWEGSNGLLLNEAGQLILMQHGDRRVVRMDAPIDHPEPKFTTLANLWRNKRLNSPNDGAYYRGDLYFTDPPFGLPKGADDPDRDLGMSGVFRIGHTGLVILVTDSISMPNGIAFTSFGEYMYVSNSDAKHAVWVKYTMIDGRPEQGKILYDATDLVGKVNGVPDGLKIHPSGYVFATGPGGIWIFSPDDKLCARIHIEQPTTNVAFDDTFKTLFITADTIVISIKMVQ